MSRRREMYGDMPKGRSITLTFTADEWRKINEYRFKKKHLYFSSYDFLKNAIMELVK